MPRTDVISIRPRAQGLIARMVDAMRSYTIGPLTAKSRELAKYFGGESTLSGIRVDEHTAMSNSAVWSAVTMIADDISSLPLMLYKRLPTGGKDRFESHPLYRLLHDEPNPEMTTMVWRRTMLVHLLLWQNAYAEIERDQVGRPVAVWPLVPERVTPFRDRSGTLRYRVANNAGGDVTISASDMIHWIGHSHDGSVGSSLVTRARESFGLGLAAEKFGASFFGNGATFGGVVSYAGPKPPELSEENYRNQLNARHQGVERAHKLLMLYNGAKFDRVGTPPDEAQFTETRIFQIREVARWFKIPPHKLGDLADATYSNVEQMDSAYLASCIRPILVLTEQELTRKLIFSSERMIQFIEHDTHGFLSVDAAGRAELYSAEFRIGTLKINEARGYENRDPIEGGDRSFVPLDMIPLDRVDEYVDALIHRRKTQSAPTDGPALPAEVKSLVASIEERMAAHAACLSAAESRSAAAETRAAALSGDVASLSAERELLVAAVEANKDTVGKTLEERARDQDAWHLRLQQLEAERMDAQSKEAAFVAAADELRLELSLQREAADRATLAQASSEAAKIAAEERANHQADAQTQAQAERDALRAHVSVTEGRLRDVMAAHRALIVDAFQRLLQRESDRARKAQSTPEKLRAWVDSFYSMHAETCRAVLRPVVLAWAPCAGKSPDATLSELVQDHVERSRREVLMAADTDDADELAANLARVLHRWETERADAVADRLIAEGDRYGH